MFFKPSAVGCRGLGFNHCIQLGPEAIQQETTLSEGQKAPKLFSLASSAPSTASINKLYSNLLQRGLFRVYYRSIGGDIRNFDYSLMTSESAQAGAQELRLFCSGVFESSILHSEPSTWIAVKELKVRYYDGYIYSQ